MTPTLIGIIILGIAAVMLVAAVDQNRRRAVIICLVIVILVAAASAQTAAANHATSHESWVPTGIAMLLILVAVWLLAIAAILVLWVHLVARKAPSAPRVPMSDDVLDHAWHAQKAQPFDWEV